MERKEMNLKKLAKMIFTKYNLISLENKENTKKRNLAQCITKISSQINKRLSIENFLMALINKMYASKNQGVAYYVNYDLNQMTTQNNNYPKEFYPYKLELISVDKLIEEKYKGQKDMIYLTFAKMLMEKGNAYPCFCENNKNNGIHKINEGENLEIYDMECFDCKELSLEDIEVRLKNKQNYCIKFSSNLKSDEIELNDEIFKTVKMEVKVKDFMILDYEMKPTFIFKQIIDDIIIQTDFVIYEEKWMDTYAIRHQIYASLNIIEPKYATIPQLMKKEGNNIKHFDLINDMYANLSFYQKVGFTYDTVVDYFLSAINPSFTKWREHNKDEFYTNYKLNLNEINKEGIILDENKLNEIGQEKLTKRTNEAFVGELLTWTFDYDKELSREINYDIFKFYNSLKLWRNEKSTGISKLSDLRVKYGYLYLKDYKIVNYNFEKEFYAIALNFLTKLNNIYKHEWNLDLFSLHIDGISKQINLDKKIKMQNVKSVKATNFNEILKIALTNSTNSINEYEVIHYIGEDEFKERLKLCIQWLNNKIESECIVNYN